MLSLGFIDYNIGSSFLKISRKWICINVDNLILDSSVIVEGFGLESIYPNPFNPSTTIEFYAESNSNVNLSIYDLSGKLVETLADYAVSSGYHSIQWDASDQSSGIYIVQLKFDSSVHSSKIMLVK